MSDGWLWEYCDTQDLCPSCFRELSESEFYINTETMQVYEMNQKGSIADIITVCDTCGEYSSEQIRHKEEFLSVLYNMTEQADKKLPLNSKSVGIQQSLDHYTLCGYDPDSAIEFEFEAGAPLNKNWVSTFVKYNAGGVFKFDLLPFEFIYTRENFPSLSHLVQSLESFSWQINHTESTVPYVL